RELQEDWLPIYQKGNLNFTNFHHLIYALQASGSPGAIGPLVDLLKTGKVPADQQDASLTLIADLGSAEQLRFILDLVAQKDTPATRKVLLLERLAQAAQNRKVRPLGDLNCVAGLLQSDNEAVRSIAIRLVGLWQIESLRAQILALASSTDGSEPNRRAAFDS